MKGKRGHDTDKEYNKFQPTINEAIFNLKFENNKITHYFYVNITILGKSR